MQVKDRIKVVHIGKFYPPHQGGIETHLHDLAVREAEVADVTVIVANDDRIAVSEVLDHVHVLRLPRIATVASMPLCPALFPVIRRCSADIVHVHLPNPWAAVALLLSGYGGKVVVTHHADTLGRRTLRKVSDPFVAWLMRRAAAVIVTSDRYLRSSDELRRYRDRCSIIPLGIDLQDIGKSGVKVRERDEIRSRFGDRIVLTVGRLVEYKGYEVLIRAMKHVDSAQLVIIGDGPEHSRLSTLIDQEGVSDKVSLLGWIEEAAPYFMAAALFVLPSVSRAEAFGIVQLEAMAVGCPVINTSLDSGVPEVSINGQTGITVPPGDDQLLAAAINRLLGCQELRRRFGEAGRQRVRAEFTADRMADRTMVLYKKILGVDQCGSDG